MKVTRHGDIKCASRISTYYSYLCGLKDLEVDLDDAFRGCLINNLSEAKIINSYGVAKSISGARRVGHLTSASFQAHIGLEEYGQ